MPPHDRPCAGPWRASQGLLNTHTTRMKHSSSTRGQGWALHFRCTEQFTVVVYNFQGRDLKKSSLFAHPCLWRCVDALGQVRGNTVIIVVPPSTFHIVFELVFEFLCQICENVCIIVVNQRPHARQEAG